MHRTRLLPFLAGALALAACSADRPELVAPTSPPRVSANIGGTVNGRFLVLAGTGGFTSDFASRVAALGGSVENQHAASGLAVVSGLGADAAQQLVGTGGVSSVGADIDVALDSPLAAADADASDVVADATIASQGNPAAAVLYARQWNMRLIGADRAWAAGKLGDPGVTVAILDTGLDYDIRELNGLVDLSRSTSFVPSDDAIATAYFPSRHKVTDFHGHGTNVAEQVSSNSLIFAGVTSKTTLIGVKVLGRTGGGSLGGILNGILWAADHGADVANLSLGGGFAKADSGRFVAMITRVFNYANAKGVLIVVAAGNDAADLDHNTNYSSNFCDQPHVICVTAVGPTTYAGSWDTPAYYTNYGRSSSDVAAPGGNANFDANGNPVLSAWPWGTDFRSWVWSFCSKTLITTFTSAGAPVTPCAAGNRITAFIGTSQATPHVAGLAALLVAAQGHGHPSQIKAAIQQSAFDGGQVGDDPYFGKGRIDVAKALGL